MIGSVSAPSQLNAQASLDVSRPDYDNDHVFVLIQKFASNYLSEMYGKYLWNSDSLGVHPAAYMILAQKNKNRIDKGKPIKNYITLYVMKHAPTVCGITEEAIMVSLFGKKYDRNTSLRKLNADSIKAIAELKFSLSSNETQTQNSSQSSFWNFFKASVPKLDNNHWNAYSVAIGGDIGHALIIVQAMKGDSIVYKLYQSFVVKYTLQEYLENHDNTLSKAELDFMLDEILEYVTTKTWTSKSNHLFTHFFKVDTNKPVGETIPYTRFVEIKWGNVSRQSMKDIAQQYLKDYPSDLKIKL